MESYDEFTLLKRSGGRLPIDNLEFISPLKKENLYLKAELEYSKKLRAVVQSRKNQQQKKN